MRGTYAILLYVPYDISLAVGELGRVEFGAGYYAYLGSALGGIERRVSRHLSTDKKVYWHIDHLMLHARAVDVVAAESEQRKECEVAGHLARELKGVRGFGSSDCRCPGHLFYHPDRNLLLSAVKRAFREAGLSPGRIINGQG
ncbi:MAG: GIY-YIG nuclease family protein [Candidatus Hadarchaeales archaeon]